MEAQGYRRSRNTEAISKISAKQTCRGIGKTGAFDPFGSPVRWTIRLGAHIIPYSVFWSNSTLVAETRVQRRLAAILAADVVAYSRLMEQDESGTLAVLKARRKEVLEPLVTRHQGRIFKITGDGVLVEFGSAVNAVQCAIDLQRGMTVANGDLPEPPRIVLRIGVNLGDVMVEGSDLYGDGVNIAARLEGIAEPGGVLVSGMAFDYVRNKVNAAFDDLGTQTLKNIAEPVRVYRIAGTPRVSVASTGTASDKPSIAVLPFTNMSGDPEQEYFADGMVEDIITALSHFKALFVIARNSSFVYKGRGVDIAQVAEELGVRYVLEGSVRKAGKPCAHQWLSSLMLRRGHIFGQAASMVDGGCLRSAGQNHRHCRRDHRTANPQGRDQTLAAQKT